MRSTSSRMLLLAVLLLAIAPISAAQPAAEGEGSTAMAEAGPPGEETAAPPPALSSPRATLRTFLESFYEDDLARAARTLDLSRVPANVRQRKSRELAIQLKDVIDRTELVDLPSVPDRRRGDQWVFLHHEEGRVVIARSEDGAWRFTPRTVESIPELWRATEDQARVEGAEAAQRSFGLWVRSKMPAELREVGFLLEHWQWLGLLLIIGVGFLLDRLVTLLLSTAFERRLRRRAFLVDADLLRSGLRPWGLLAMALLWRLTLPALELPPTTLGILQAAVDFVAVTAVIWAAYRMVDVVTAIFQQRAERTESRFDDLLVPLIRKSLKVFITVFGLVFLADNLALDVGSLLAGLGLGGLAFALAAQDTVKNLFGSITVLLDRPFHVGDWVVIGDVEGTVEELGFRSTRVRTFYDSLITLPNADLINAAVDNLGARRYRRWSTRIALPYATPASRIEAFVEGIRELVRCHPCTRKDYFHVYLNEFGSSALEILLYVFFDTPDWGAELRERHRLALDVLRLAERLDLEVALPTQTLYLRRGPAELTAETGADGPGRVDAALEQGRREARGLAEELLGERVTPPEAGWAPERENRGEADS